MMVYIKPDGQIGGIQGIALFASVNMLKTFCQDIPGTCLLLLKGQKRKSASCIAMTFEK
jgi:hypothetical protein